MNDESILYSNLTGANPINSIFFNVQLQNYESTTKDPAPLDGFTLIRVWIDRLFYHIYIYIAKYFGKPCLKILSVCVRVFLFIYLLIIQKPVLVGVNLCKRIHAIEN